MQRFAAQIIDPADDEYLISFNGAQVVRAKSGTVVFEWLLPETVIADAIAYADENAVHIQGYSNGRAYTEGRSPMAAERRAEYTRSTGMEVHHTDDLARTVGTATPKLLLIDEVETMPTHLRELERRSAGRYRVTLSKPHYLEILHPTASKGAALRRLAEELNIPISETIAVGDSFNDIEMIQAAGLGIAVANAIPEVKAIADVVLDRTAAEGAIEEIVERFF